MGYATSPKKLNTITRENIARAAEECFRRSNGEKVKPAAIFSRLVDFPNIAHPRHTNRFMRLLPLEVDVTDLLEWAGVPESTSQETYQ